MIKKGTWVEVEEIVLIPENRAKNIPEETKITPLKCWTRGYCISDCSIGDEVKVETNVGRIASGIIVDIEPGYYHTYGKYVQEIGHIGKQAREIIGGP
ncbi:MAG: 2-amino-4-ketopentanoate thiolase [Clostridiaceae bacterium]|nr:2-amino-4-ketopentanoate thiolase [Clostridiaceae bacterium]